MLTLYEEVTVAVTGAIEEELKLQPREMHNTFYVWALRLRHEHRVYYINADMAREQLWAELRRDEKLLDLVLRASIGFYGRLVDGNGGDHLFTSQCTTLAKGIGSAVNKNGAVADDTFTEKVPQQETVASLLQSEIWLCFSLSLERCLTRVVPNHLLESLTSRPAGNARSSGSKVTEE